MATMHLGTKAGTLCCKPLARRWWFEWPPKARVGRIGNLTVREEEPSQEPANYTDCKACIRAANELAEAGKGAKL